MTFRSCQIRWMSIVGALTVAVVLSGCNGNGGGIGVMSQQQQQQQQQQQ